MRAHQIDSEASLSNDWIETIPPLRVVILYDNVEAGKRAMSVLTDLSKGIRDHMEVKPFPWSFELLTERCWREVAEEDVLLADILIIASIHAPSLPTAVEQWTQAMVSQKKGTDAAVVALFDMEGFWAQGNAARVEALRVAAHQAGLAFFASGISHRLDSFWEQPGPRPPRAPSLQNPFRPSDSPMRWGLNE